MTEVMLPVFAGLVSIALPIWVLVVLHPHLAAALAELCGARHRGDFWVRVMDAAMLAGPLLCGLVAVSLSGRGAFALALAVLRGTGAGLVISVGVMTAIVLGFTARMAAGVAPPPVVLPGARR
ncbi:MAG: hypothetical protein ACR2MY_08110 [Candidatus Dormibacteria bacterium]